MILLDSSVLIDLADLLIGATAKYHNIPLATLNKKHFQRIDGLVLI
jgi:tRNA(fMet)-specific endonuclease VapC